LARAYFNTADPQRALELYQENNVNGINDGVIAQFLADNLKRHDEALPYAKRAWSHMVQELIGAAVALASIYLGKGEDLRALDCLQWLLQVLESLRPQGGFCETDIMCANLLQAVGELYLERMEDETRSWELMEQALRLALAYDAVPQEQVSSCRFFEGRLPGMWNFYLGGSAMEFLETRISQLEKKRPEMVQRWRELRRKLEKEQENHA